MTYDELLTLLKYDEEHENHIYIPNEIFTILHNNIPKDVHIPFVYSYYYLICWLYRYAKYGSIYNLDNKQIKSILGYNPDTKGLDYLTKKNGLMDSINLTITDKDFPCAWDYSHEEGLSFTLLSDFDEDTQEMIKQQLNKKFTIKYPIKAFFRYDESEEIPEGYDESDSGTFFDFSNTHNVSFDVFLFCMSMNDIGCTGFYMYSYFKMMNQLYPEGFNISREQMVEEIKLPHTTLERYLSRLRKYRMLDVRLNQDFFVLGLDEDERKSNTYIVNNYIKFTNKPIVYDKMKTMTRYEYHRLKKQQDKEIIWEEQLGNLPY